MTPITHPGLRRFLAFALALCALLLAGCAAPAAAQPDMNAALTQAVSTILAGATKTAQSLPATPPPPVVTPTLAATPSPTPDPNRTPPALPGPFTTGQLNPRDTPHSYISDSCAALRARWDPANAAPGTVLMPIMFHSITKGQVTSHDQISMTEFRKLMNDLHDMGFVAVNMQQAVDFLYNNAKIPPRSVLLIVDDRKYREYFDLTFKDYHDQWGWPVVNSWINADDSIYTLSIQENVDLEKEGWVDHQSHGYIHNTPMGDNSSDEFLKGELLGSMEKMQRDFGKTPVAIIWPGGGFGLRPVQAARTYGYKLGFTINPRGPILFNWVPQDDNADPARPSYIPEGPAGDPLMTLPRYWDTDADAHLDTVRIIGQEAAAYAEQNKATELEYYDIVCAPSLGPLPQP